jgi:trehalose 6-phosphate synthase
MPPGSSAIGRLRHAKPSYVSEKHAPVICVSFRRSSRGPIPTSNIEQRRLGWKPDHLVEAASIVSDSRLSAAGFVVVANRLPVDRHEQADGSTEWRRSPGGLVTALAPVMRANDGAWIGWVGAPDDAPEPFVHAGMSLIPVGLSREEVEQYYEGFSNSTLWPLYHDVIMPPRYHRPWWNTYVRVNQRFADATAKVAEPGATVWVQDYQLQLVPKMLRESRPDLRVGFFLHIPFPPRELFQQLPWRTQILEGLLGADLVGFQVPGAANNFCMLAEELLGLDAGDGCIKLRDRTVQASAFPISIQFDQVSKLADSASAQQRAKEIRDELGNPHYVLLGVDRLDYTKGIGHRLKAFGELLAEGRIGEGEAVFVQVANPSRERVRHYRILRDEIELQVGRINGDYARLGFPVINYIHSAYEEPELVALLRAADVMAVTPLRDGMNLVAKEYVAARTDERGALVLSEFAGAAQELRDAYLVNPHDIEGLKRSILVAMHATPEEQARRMRAMRQHIARHDVNMWARSFLDALRKSCGDAYETED